MFQVTGLLSLLIAGVVLVGASFVLGALLISVRNFILKRELGNLFDVFMEMEGAKKINLKKNVRDVVPDWSYDAKHMGEKLLRRGR